jgi:hypothetical protein
VRELDMQRALIAGRLAELDPTLALPTMLRFLGLAEGVSHRTADAKGEVEAVFDAAVDDVAAIAPWPCPTPAPWAISCWTCCCMAALAWVPAP